MHLSDMSNGFGDRTLTLNSVDSNVISDMSPESNVLSPTGWPRATLVCRPNSHPFQVSTFAGYKQRWQKIFVLQFTTCYLFYHKIIAGKKFTTRPKYKNWTKCRQSASKCNKCHIRLQSFESESCFTVV